MFKKVFIKMFLRNLLILWFLAPLLSIYAMMIATRIPDGYREKALDYIISTGKYDSFDGSLSLYDYHYFYFTTDRDINSTFISEITPQENEKEEYIQSVKRYHNYGNILNFSIIRPEGFHHKSVGSYYFSSKEETTDNGYLFHVIYNNDGNAFSMVMAQVADSGKIFALFVTALSLLLAYFELRTIRRAWVLQKHFIAQASHDLRTPVTVITSALEYAENAGFSVWAKCSEIIGREVSHIKSMLDGLMFLSRIDAKQMKLQLAHVDIPTLLLETYISAEIVADRKSIRFEEFKDSESDDLLIYADETLLKQLVMILLENAIEYTGPGGTVSLSCAKQGSKVVVTVSDSGIGIDKKDLKRIFKRFYRVDKSRSGEGGNSGLGLYIAKWITDQHRGSIKVESTVGHGSKFIVTLPVKSRRRGNTMLSPDR